MVIKPRRSHSLKNFTMPMAATFFQNKVGEFMQLMQSIGISINNNKSSKHCVHSTIH